MRSRRWAPTSSLLETFIAVTRVRSCLLESVNFGLELCNPRFHLRAQLRVVRQRRQGRRAAHDSLCLIKTQHHHQRRCQLDATTVLVHLNMDDKSSHVRQGTCVACLSLRGLGGGGVVSASHPRDAALHSNDYTRLKLERDDIARLPIAHSHVSVRALQRSPPP